MSDFKHKPFTELWFTARNDNGNNPQEEHVAYAGEYQPYRDDVAYNPEYPLVVYRAEVEWVPYKRIYEDECGYIEEKLLIHPAGGPVTKVQRLQSAVRDLLESLNAAEFEIYYQDPYDGGFKPCTTETYGLTEKDME